MTPDTRHPNGAAAAIHAGFPVVRLVRPPPYHRPLRLDLLRGPNFRGFYGRLVAQGPEKIHLENCNVPQHIKNLATITSLMAFKEYRPGDFNAFFGEDEKDEKVEENEKYDR